MSEHRSAQLADAPLDVQAAGLHAIIRESPALRSLLEWAGQAHLPSWYVGAGAVAQTVWNHAHDLPAGHGLRDYDLVYFDPDDLSKETEEAHEARATDALGLPVDVTNEARVHLWYERRFGRPIEPYRSAEAAIATWPSTATTVGIRIDGDAPTVCAPFGLRDLFALVVRPNRAIVPREVYETKAARWATTWPRLSIEPW